MTHPLVDQFREVAHVSQRVAIRGRGARTRPRGTLDEELGGGVRDEPHDGVHFGGRDRERRHRVDGFAGDAQCLARRRQDAHVRRRGNERADEEERSRSHSQFDVITKWPRRFFAIASSVLPGSNGNSLP